MNDPVPPLVSTDWLAARLGAPGLVVVDGSFHLPAEKRDARVEHSAAHIPGAVFFDIDAIADRANPLPHMLPSPDAFAAAVGALGIGSEDHVVAYDVYGLMSAGRIWWTFRTFGHDRVSVLDGGLLKWRAEHRTVESGAVARAAARFAARVRPELVRNRAWMMNNVGRGDAQVVDARAAGRFAGIALPYAMPQPHRW